MIHKYLCALAAAAAAMAMPAAAEIRSSSDTGFALAASATVAADPAQVWATLVRPSRWWSAEHTFSHDAANLSLDARPGGCFCEALPGKPAGGVQHMTVLFSRPGEMLRMSGALGPMQGEGLAGTLTAELKPAANGGTTITFSYVVGGYARFPLKQVAPAVDQVLGEQLTRLAAAVKAR